MADVVVFNNGVSPDPFPSPDVNPITATVRATHAFAAGGAYVIAILVTDDSGGSASIAFIVMVGG